MEKIRIGVSSCLLGGKVRYDGKHKLDSYIVGTLAGWFELVPFCPESELGLGIPREPIQLEGDPADPRLMKVETREDLTAAMRCFCRERVSALKQENLDGCILKSRSPSCGLERVKVFSDDGVPAEEGRGLFAAELMRQFPLIPVEEECRLTDPARREKFFAELFTLRRWRNMLAGECTRGGLVKFHERHKYLFMAHSVEHYRALGRITASMKGRRLSAVQADYLEQMRAALRLRAAPAKQVNVLQHLAGYFKKQLTANEKQELAETIAAYRQGRCPLLVPVTLLNHYVRKYDELYLKQQFYLNPGETELRVRNQVY